MGPFAYLRMMEIVCAIVGVIGLAFAWRDRRAAQRRAEEERSTATYRRAVLRRVPEAERAALEAAMAKLEATMRRNRSAMLLARSKGAAWGISVGENKVVYLRTLPPTNEVWRAMNEAQAAAPKLAEMS